MNVCLLGVTGTVAWAHRCLFPSAWSGVGRDGGGREYILPSTSKGGRAQRRGPCTDHHPTQDTHSPGCSCARGPRLTHGVPHLRWWWWWQGRGGHFIHTFALCVKYSRASGWEETPRTTSPASCEHLCLLQHPDT